MRMDENGIHVSMLGVISIFLDSTLDPIVRYRSLW